jgi:hypothetical protein
MRLRMIFCRHAPPHPLPISVIIPPKPPTRPSNQTARQHFRRHVLAFSQISVSLSDAAIACICLQSPRQPLPHLANTFIDTQHQTRLRTSQPSASRAEPQCSPNTTLGPSSPSSLLFKAQTFCPL